MKILNFTKLAFNKSYLTISILGKNYKLNLKYSNIKTVKLVKSNDEINIFMPKNLSGLELSSSIDLAIKKLYNDLAESEIEASLELARHILKFAPEDYKIERLKGSYYRCSQNKTLIINPDIIKYSSEIINTTILQAFCKIMYKQNTSMYNHALENAMKKYEAYKASYKEKCLNSFAS